ncbi:phage terminase large subunit [Cerasibacillus quisquiliarum]|uniref:Terminase n=2 Tax=Cerasibacillus quisquiliarum TaxID=227865 RepID=A0A511UUG1_9BACI|nr:PBSX family phage terminase large subunit [Cerasibacillus quisquiliarum]MBB5144864.1 phage terminase large subunit [Cerasibacillus quisquiliarum]GEN30245.1 terminase [Cerasibacillus quisquiliarum]
MSNKHVINIQKEVNPAFKSVWTSNKPYNILKGGRNSFKSSVIALKLVYMMLQYIRKGEKANVVVLRKVASTIRDSVYNKIQWAIGKFGFTVVAGNESGDFKATVAPFKITHNATGSTFYFYGLDQFEKLKSNDINDIIAVWYEESAEFENQEEFDQTNVTFMRQVHELAPFVQFFWSYNPPRNPYSWINEWSDSMIGEDDYLVHHSSYQDDELGFVTEQMLADIERIKRNDYDYYRYLYLGEPVGLGTNVYNMSLFKPIDELFDDDPLILIDTATDTGHQVSATTHLAFGLTAKRKVILLDTYYYSPQGKVNKKAPSELSEGFFDFYTKTRETFKKPYDVHTIDSAEGALRNQIFKDYGLRLHPIAKKKKIEMIDNVHSLLADGRFYYLDTPNNKVFIEEHKKYQWDEKTLDSDNPRVIEVDDHTCDAFIYYVNDNLRKLGLKF